MQYEVRPILDRRLVVGVRDLQVALCIQVLSCSEVWIQHRDIHNHLSSCNVLDSFNGSYKAYCPLPDLSPLLPSLNNIIINNNNNQHECLLLLLNVTPWRSIWCQPCDDASDTVSSRHQITAVVVVVVVVVSGTTTSQRLERQSLTWTSKATTGDHHFFFSQEDSEY